MASGLRIILVGATLLSFGTAAGAVAPASPTAKGIDRASAMSRADLQATLERRFDAADSNHDGTLTPDERTAQMQARRAAGRERLFARLDADRNGAISKEEFNAAQQGRFHRGRKGAEMRRPSAAGADKPITRADFVKGGLARFDRLDTDHDGRISAVERDAARKALRDHLAPAHSPQPLPPGS